MIVDRVEVLPLEISELFEARFMQLFDKFVALLHLEVFKLVVAEDYFAFNVFIIHSFIGSNSLPLHLIISLSCCPSLDD